MSMRTPLLFIGLILLAACKEQEAAIEPPPEAVEKGVARAVADVRAAETAAAEPVTGAPAR